MVDKKKVIIGTRGSRLAISQAEEVKAVLSRNYPHIAIDIAIIKTRGDRILDLPLSEIGGKGLFVKEVEEALLDDKIDLAVHSMKDMPIEIPDGLCIGAVTKREDPRDVLVCREGFSFSKFYNGIKVGTSSLRRSSQLLHSSSGIDIVPIRGNLETRIHKLNTEGLDVVVLAAAGLIRLGLRDRINQFLEFETMLPAVGQGALCIEVRKDDVEIRRFLSVLDDSDTRNLVLSERAFLARLDGGCQFPIAANAFLKASGKISLTGLVSSRDGSFLIRRTLTGSISAPEDIGFELGEVLLSLGAGNIL